MPEMNDINNADNAEKGDSDIAGVKSGESPVPDGENDAELHVADEAKKTEDGAEDTDDCALETEFEELINGRFKKAYKRKTEAIIRKRLRSGKARPTEGAGDDTPRSQALCAQINEENAASLDSKLKPKADMPKSSENKIEAQRKSNLIRPLENGLGGSCGVVSKINVSVLNGNDIRNILKRVGSGEKITFK